MREYKIKLKFDPREKAFCLIEESNELALKTINKCKELDNEAKKIFNPKTDKEKELLKNGQRIHKETFGWPYPQKRIEIIEEAWEVYKTSTSIRDCEMARMMLQLSGEISL